MGFTYVNVTVRGMRASRDVRMLAGTGSTYIVLDPETIKELGAPRDALHRRPGRREEDQSQALPRRGGGQREEGTCLRS
jgi:predicted aspartyl protease